MSWVRWLPSWRWINRWPIRRSACNSQFFSNSLPLKLSFKSKNRLKMNRNH